MSFFGFDTSLPRDKKGGGLDDPFASLGSGAAGGALDDEQLDAKIRGLTAGAQEDVQIYEWGGEGYDGLGDMLDEAGDDLNADTFGAEPSDIGKDFDFGHGPSAAAAPAKPASKANDSMFASNFDDFWALPSMTKKAALPAPVQQQQQQQQPPPPTRAAKTMEEIEAELRASRISQQPQPPAASSSPAPGGRRPMTMEEIEAEMRGGRPAPQQQQQQQPTQQQPMPMPSGAQPPSGPFAGLMQPPPSGAPQQTSAAPPLGPRNDVDFPALGARPPPPTGPLAGGPPPPTGPARGAGPLPPAAMAMQQSHASMQAQQAEHFARMQAMLRALPEPVQQGITSLPPQLHFDVLQGVGREFAVLLQPAATDEDREVQARATAAAVNKLRGIHRFEEKRNQRAAKIAAMSRYNNLMSVSDKEFITRIQISQILPNDPYAEDFYAHIYFALRGRPGPNPGLMGAAPQQPAAQQKQPPKGPKRMNAQQKAMLRMQQQVERLVADRKSRIEKAAQGTANPNLEGALGKVGLNVAGNPRQALQIGKKGGDSDAAAASGGATTAADVVRQALEGASLDKNSGSAAATSADGKRPPLTRHQALRILEELYDTTLALEQLRRSVDGDAEARAEQESLTSHLWKELRVLEPLEISDPHPFVSLLNTTKGKRLLPRALRHLSSEQTLTALTMIVASFDSLDVVRHAAILDDERAEGGEARREMETQTDVFSNTIVPAMLGLMATSPFKIVIGMLALFVERNDVVLVARSRAGIAFLTILLSRAEALKQGSGNNAPAPKGDAESSSPPPPSPEEQAQWTQIFRLLFERLVTRSGSLASLLPSTRAKAAQPFGFSSHLYYGGSSSVADLERQRRLDESDEPAWNLFAALAVSASMEEQSVLVQELREKILENVLEARSKGGSVELEQAGRRKLRLVNIFLNALNLDASQITV